MRVEVYSGWIQLREPELVPERLRRPVFEKSVSGVSFVDNEDATINEDTMKFFSEFNDLVAIAMISEWSFEAPLTIDGMLDLPSKSYDEIRTAVSPFVTKLIPSFGVDPDPKATTENSEE
jgi:hypothetical protein